MTMLPERTCAGMIPDTPPDTEAATPADAVVMRMLASALTELPQPIRVSVELSTYALRVSAHLRNGDDTTRWRRWWGYHGVDGWDVSHDDSEYRQHHSIGTWRGWVVDLVHLTDLPAPAVAA